METSELIVVSLCAGLPVLLLVASAFIFAYSRIKTDANISKSINRLIGFSNVELLNYKRKIDELEEKNKVWKENANYWCEKYEELEKKLAKLKNN